jgi:hypothetical protein
MSTETKAEAEAYVDVEARSKADAEAKAEAKVQGEAQSALLTERGIQCQKAHELVDLWFYGEWDAVQFKRWLVLTAQPEDSVDLPSLGKLVAVLGLLLGGMAPPTPPARVAAPAPTPPAQAPKPATRPAPTPEPPPVPTQHPRTPTTPTR